MIIWAKVGTHAARHIRVVRKRRPPKLNEWFEFYDDTNGAKRVGAIVREIKVLAETLYYLELM